MSVPTANRLKLLTLNIHKGLSAFNQRSILEDLRSQLRAIHADIVFLQEVRGDLQSGKNNQWEFLADEIWPEMAYGRNAIYEHTHHGNAILSKYPIEESLQQELPSHRLEQRGYLEALIRIPGFEKKLHLVNVHLGLFGFHRRQQIDFIHETVVPKSEARILAGDFNDWAHGTHHDLLKHGWVEAHLKTHGRLARSFPSFFPLLKLDRIYTKELKVIDSKILTDRPWRRLSDHLPLAVEIELQ